MLNLKERWSALSTDAKTAVRNLERLVEAISLLVVSVFSYLVVIKKVDATTLSKPMQYVVVGACAVIGLRGMYEFLSYLANKGEKG